VTKPTTHLIRQVSCASLAQWLGENPEALLLDVRTREEFENEALPKTILIPIQEWESRAGEVISLVEGRKVLLICRAGHRSMVAARILTRQWNHPDTHNLTEGMLGLV